MTLFRGLARIVVGPTTARVYAPISANPLIRSMPNRRWSPPDSAWLIPAYDVGIMHHRLESAGYTVRVIEPGKPMPPLVLPKTPVATDATGNERKAP